MCIYIYVLYTPPPPQSHVPPGSTASTAVAHRGADGPPSPAQAPRTARGPTAAAVKHGDTADCNAKCMKTFRADVQGDKCPLR